MFFAFFFRTATSMIIPIPASSNVRPTIRKINVAADFFLGVSCERGVPGWLVLSEVWPLLDVGGLFVSC